MGQCIDPVRLRFTFRAWNINFRCILLEEHSNPNNRSFSEQSVADNDFTFIHSVSFSSSNIFWNTFHFPFSRLHFLRFTHLRCACFHFIPLHSAYRLRVYFLANTLSSVWSQRASPFTLVFLDSFTLDTSRAASFSPRFDCFRSAHFASLSLFCVQIPLALHSYIWGGDHSIFLHCFDFISFCVFLFSR